MKASELDVVLSQNTEVRCQILQALMERGSSTIADMSDFLGRDRIWLGRNAHAMAEASILKTYEHPSDRRKVLFALNVKPDLVMASPRFQEWMKKQEEKVLDTEPWRRDIAARLGQIAAIKEDMDPEDLPLVASRLAELQEWLEKKRRRKG